VDRPFKELKGFSKTVLHTGEKQTVTISLDSSSFAYFRESKNGFGMDYGTYKLLIGASSRDIRLSDSIKFKNPMGVKPEILTYYPSNHSELATAWQKFSIKFTNAVYFEAGKKIVIKEASSNKIVETIQSTGGTETDSITFLTRSALNVGATYYIEIDSGAFVDFYDHAYPGLTGPDQWRFTVTATGFDQLNEIPSFAVYPVPASDFVNFSISDNSTFRKKIEIFDEVGKIVDAIGFERSLNPISYNCSKLKSGIYYCKYTSNKSIIVRKFLICR
jgi:hypothetical protein